MTEATETIVERLNSRIDLRRFRLANQPPPSDLARMAHEQDIELEEAAKAVIERLQARVKELEEATEGLLRAVCGDTGFAEAVRFDSGRAYPWPALDIAEEKARAVLQSSGEALPPSPKG